MDKAIKKLEAEKQKLSSKLQNEKDNFDKNFAMKIEKYADQFARDRKTLYVRSSMHRSFSVSMINRRIMMIMMMMIGKMNMKRGLKSYKQQMKRLLET